MAMSVLLLFFLDVCLSKRASMSLVELLFNHHELLLWHRSDIIRGMGEINGCIWCDRNGWSVGVKTERYNGAIVDCSSCIC